MLYTTHGTVRGACGHRHYTIAAAMACIRKDQRGCKRQGGYSDRIVTRLDGGTMTTAEADQIVDIEMEASWS